MLETGKETKEERGKMRRREEEKEENETVSVKRRRVGCFLWCQEGDLESRGGLSCLWEEPEDLSDCEPDSCALVRVVPVVTDVLVFLSSVVSGSCDGFSFCSDWKLVEPQSFLSPQLVLTLGQLHRITRGSKTHE